jgi:Sugar kinases, ribokinase family
MNTAPAAICVVGSLNMDLVVRSPQLPSPGQTISGGPFATYHGGKGANQAVAAARLGGKVAMIGRVGDDAFGSQLRDGLAREGYRRRSGGFCRGDRIGHRADHCSRRRSKYDR